MTSLFPFGVKYNNFINNIKKIFTFMKLDDFTPHLQQEASMSLKSKRGSIVLSGLLISAVGWCLRAVLELCLPEKSMCNPTRLSGNLALIMGKVLPCAESSSPQGDPQPHHSDAPTFPISTLCALRQGPDRDRCSQCVG